jgi:hypothetical protein
MRRASMAILLLASLTVIAQSSAAFTLVCHVGNDQTGYRDYNVNVDPSASTVNGMPAIITVEEARWIVNRDGRTFRSTINRYTSTLVITVVDDKTGHAVSSQATCVPDPRR